MEVKTGAEDLHRIARGGAEAGQHPFRMGFAADEAPVMGQRRRAEEVEDSLQLGAMPAVGPRLELEGEVGAGRV